MPTFPALLLLLGVTAMQSTAGADVVPGRAVDGRVAAVTERLIVAARARCPSTEPSAGLLLQHLSQFALPDRAGMARALALDRGPGVVAVVSDGPAATAGVRAGDVLLSVNGTAVPPESGLDRPFDARRAHDRADSVADLLASGSASLTLELLRDGVHVRVTVTPRPACTARVRLARSDQRNAFADGRHLLLTTGLVSLLRGDDELAFVIAHELAHNQLGHPALIRGGGRNRRFVRDTEAAADAMAGEMMLDAGYDPVAGAELLPRLGDGMRIALFADHGSGRSRVEAMRPLAAARARP